MSDDSNNPYGVGASIASVYEADVPIVLRPVIRWIGWIHCVLVAIPALCLAGLALSFVWDGFWGISLLVSLPSLPFFAAAIGMQKHLKQPLQKKERIHARLMLALVCIPLIAVCPILVAEFKLYGGLSGHFRNPIRIAFVALMMVSVAVRWSARNSHLPRTIFDDARLGE